MSITRAERISIITSILPVWAPQLAACTTEEQFRAIMSDVSEMARMVVECLQDPPGSSATEDGAAQSPPAPPEAGEEQVRTAERLLSLRRDLSAARRTIQATHTLWTDADADRPAVICDRNHSVVLGLCKLCGAAEAELEDRVCTGERPAS